MKFRTAAISALSATAFIPFAAWTLVQVNDVQKSLEHADREQQYFSDVGAAFINERLQNIEILLGNANVRLTNAFNANATPEEIRGMLIDLRLSSPYFSELRIEAPGAGPIEIASVDGESIPAELLDANHAASILPEPLPTPRAVQNDKSSCPYPGTTHAAFVDDVVAPRMSARWALEPARHVQPTGAYDIAEDEQMLVVRRTLSDHSGRKLVAVVPRARLLHDLVDMYASRGITFAIVDDAKNFIWPPNGMLGETAWKHPTVGQNLVKTAMGHYFVTAHQVMTETPSWTLLAVKSQDQRTGERASLLTRMTEVGLLVMLLTILTAVLTLRPLINAMKKMRADLHDQHYGAEENTITSGPEEIIEFQKSYRALRARLDGRHRALETQNAALEESVEEKSQALAAQEKLFAQVFEDIAEGMVLLDTNFVLEHANPAAKSLLSGNKLEELISTAQKSLESELARVSRETSAHIRVSVTFTYECTLEDSGRIFECAAFPIGHAASPAPNGSVIDAEGYCILFRDVTAKTQLERMKDDLISIVAHELRTPVTACRLQLDLLEAENPQSSACGAMRSDLEHLAHIIDDWLAVAKIKGGRFTVEPEIVQLLPLISKAVRIVRANHDFTLSTDIDKAAECVRVDPKCFVDLIVNLLTNACRYAKKDQKPEIEFHAHVFPNGAGAVQGPTLELRVVDHGMGFPEEEKERIFERFHQVDHGSKRRSGGTGLGLVICRAIAEAHGGTIEAESSPAGTAFTVRIPHGF